ncbi:MAG: PAS domain S-box protein [Chloroflexota bacterium]
MRLLRNRHFWLVLVLFVLLSLFHYVEQLGIGPSKAPSLHFGLTRHALDRILFLIPIVYSGFVFGLVAGLVTSFIALLVMLPRAIAISPAPGDALLEMFGVIVVGVLACLWIRKRSKEKEQLRKALDDLESAHRMLQRYVRSARSIERRLTTLNAISSVLTASLELQNVLQRAIHMVMELMDVEVALIFTLDEEAKELELVAHEGVSEEFAHAVNRMKVGEGFNGAVAQTGKPMIVEDVSRDPRLTRPEVRKMKTKSQLVVPLTVKEHTIGTLCVAMRRPRQFLQEEMELLTAVGNQIGVAVENARLYERERQTAERLRRSERDYRGLFENANDAIWVHDLQGNITTANKAAARLTGYDIAELLKMNAAGFLSDDAKSIAREARRRLMLGEPIGQPYDQQLIKKDGTMAILKLTSSLVTTDGRPTGFQHIARDVTEEKRMQDNLRYYLQQITRAQEEERKRIAREFHDETAQALYALTRQVDNFTRSSASLAPDHVSFLKSLENQINEVLRGVRRTSQALRPPMLDDLGLLATLRWLLDELGRQSGIEARLEVLGTERRFHPEVELTVFRIVQEALRNIERHSHASKASVTVEFKPDKTVFSVSDNGKGFDVSQSLSDLPRSGKLGLAGIEERVRLLGGTVKVNSEPGRGTTLTVETPI